MESKRSLKALLAMVFLAVFQVSSMFFGQVYNFNFHQICPPRIINKVATTCRGLDGQKFLSG